MLLSGRSGPILRHTGPQPRPAELDLQERVGLERRLHDGPALRLSALALNVAQLADGLPAGDDALRQRLAALLEQLQTAVAELRQLGSDILPPMLLGHGIGPALEALAEDRGIGLTLSRPEGRLPQRVEAAVYFAVVGAIQTRPAGSGVAVTVQRRRRDVVVRIAEPDGAGPRAGRLAALIFGRARDTVVLVPCG